MESRRVTVTLEIESVMPLEDLRQRNFWEAALPLGETVLQVQANVIRARPRNKKKR